MLTSGQKACVATIINSTVEEYNNLIKYNKIMSIFANKTLLITGGTGSFGNAVLRRFLDSDIKEIRIFSHDEKKLSNKQL